MAEDYYKSLGVGRSASAEEIQKAYRKLARKHHPDMNPDDAGAKKRFQEIQKAYDVLNDPEKRKMYDQFGSGFEQMHGGAGGGNPFSGGQVDLNDLFGRGGAFGGMDLGDLFRQFGAGGRRDRKSAPGEPLHAPGEISKLRSPYPLPLPSWGRNVDPTRSRWRGIGDDHRQDSGWHRRWEEDSFAGTGWRSAWGQERGSSFDGAYRCASPLQTKRTESRIETPTDTSRGSGRSKSGSPYRLRKSHVVDSPDDE